LTSRGGLLILFFKRNIASVLLNEYPGYNAIKVGRLFLKPADLYETLTLSCRMTFHEAADHSLPVGRSGSATLISFKGKKFVVTTRHQFELEPGAQLSDDILNTIRIGTGSETLSNIPVDSCIFETSNLDEEYHDIIVFCVSEGWKDAFADAPYFFPLSGFSQSVRRLSFFVGYPSLSGVMDSYLEGFGGDGGSIDIKRCIGDCTLANSVVRTPRYFRTYNLNKDLETADGLSGGAVFSLIGEIGDYEIMFDGIIVRGGRNHIHIVDADFLVSMLSL